MAGAAALNLPRPRHHLSEVLLTSPAPAHHLCEHLYQLARVNSLHLRGVPDLYNDPILYLAVHDGDEEALPLGGGVPDLNKVVRTSPCRHRR